MSLTSRSSSVSGNYANQPPPSNGSQTTRAYTSKQTGDAIRAADDVDYSSVGASVEESRPDRWTTDFIRSLTPRSLHACAENGILARELLYKPVDTFSGIASASSTTGVIATIVDGEAPALIQQLRFKDYETSRLVALDKCKTTRRRNISGMRHSLFGLQKMPQRSEGNSTVALPHVHSGHSTSSLHSHSHSHSHTQQPSRSPSNNHSRQLSTLSHSANLYPPQHQIKEHPFFKSHPQHDRVHGLQHTSGQVAPSPPPASSNLDSIEWNSNSVEGRGHLCLRMREHLLRESERAEWERQEQKRDDRARRRREQRENEWYQEQKIQVKGYTSGGSSSRKKKTKTKNGEMNVSTTSDIVSPRLTRTEILRAAGAISRVQQQKQLQQQQQQHQQHHQLSSTMNVTSSSSSNDTNPSYHQSTNLSATAPLAKMSHQQQHGHRPSVSSSMNMNGPSSSVNNAIATTASNTNNNNPNNNNNTTMVANGTSTTSNSKTDLSMTYEDRHNQSIATIAHRYTTFFEREKQKMLTRQENELHQIATAEKYRLDLLKRQDDTFKRRLERQRLAKAQRDASAKEMQQARESKYARVEHEEYQRIQKLEQQYDEKHDKILRKRAEYEQQLQDGIRQRQTEGEQRNDERKWHILQAHENKHRRLIQNLKRLYTRYEEAQLKLAESKARQQQERQERNQMIERKLQVSLERQAEECQRKYHEHLERTERHAIKDTSHMVRHAHDIAQQRANKSKEKEEMKSYILSVKDDERRQRVEQILAKDRRDAERLKELSERKNYEHVVMLEQKQLEQQRKDRNLERENRRIAFQHKQLADKLEQDDQRLESIQSMKDDYSRQRDEFAKRAFNQTREFRESLNRSRKR